jgi:hypothetical protein
MQAIRDAIKEMTNIEHAEALPEPVQAAYGEVHFAESADLLDNLDQLNIQECAMHSNQPLPMESYGMSYGLVAYLCAPDNLQHVINHLINI